MVNDNFCLFKLLLVILLLSWALYFIFYNSGSARPRLKERLANIFQERLFDFLITLFIAGLALFSSRNISLFGLVSFIIICTNLAPVLIALRTRCEARLNFWQKFFNPSLDRLRFSFLIFLLLAIIIAYFYVVSDEHRANHLIKNSFGLGLYQDNEASAAFFKEKKLSGPIFNDYDIGSALIFWFYGQEKVFVDNRPEAYSNSFFNDVYKPLQTDAAKWEEYSRQYDFKTIYFAYTDSTPWAQQFLGRILEDKKWRLVYFDTNAVILINSEKYQTDEVQALSLNEWAFKKRMRELSAGASLKTKLQLANLARLAGLPEMAEEVYREILFAWPEQAQTLSSLAGLYASYSDQENLIKAVSYSQRALDAGLRLPSVYNQLGLAYWRLGQYKKAADAWRLALKQERKNVDAWYYLNQVEALRQSGELPASN